MPVICDYENSTYRTAFWEGQERTYEHLGDHMAVERLLPRGERVLELGAGFGRLADLYDDYSKVVLLDYSHSQLEYARDQLGTDKYIFVAADVYHLPFAPAQFDIITMVRTLHHMEEPLTAVKQVRSALCSGGTFIVEYPNVRNLKEIARWLLRGRGSSDRNPDNPFKPSIVESGTVYYMFHPKSVHRLLKDAAFAPNRRRAVGYLRPSVFKRVFPTWLQTGLEAVLQPTGNLYPLSPSVFVRSEAVGQDEQGPEGAFWRCPACGGFNLEEQPSAIYCTDCQSHWPFEDGIYDFRPKVEASQKMSVKKSEGW
jgi:SAM-dependent methyltransferase